MEEARELLVTADTDQRTAYFERVCLRAPACEVTTAVYPLYPLPSPPSLSPLQRAWVFERAVGYLVEGHDDRVIAGVASRRECEELCLLGTGQFRTQWCLLNSGVFTLCLISMQWGRLARYIEVC